MITTQTNVYDSSTIEASTYNFKTCDLFITFKHATYLYKDVAEIDYKTFAEDNSQGKALNSLIKGKYEYVNLSKDEE